jgi:Xaa-Pro aminopeptidase
MIIRNTVYKQRRKQLAKILGDGVVIIRNSSDQVRSNDTMFPFRSNSYFHYFSGFPESNAVMVINCKPFSAWIFSKTKDKTKEIWDGFIYGPKEAARKFLFDQGLDLKHFDDSISDLLAKNSKVYLLQEDLNLRDLVSKKLNHLSNNKRADVFLKNEIISLNTFADPMRSIKSADELKVIRHAANISSKAHLFVMANIHADSFEYQIEARLKYFFGVHNARNEAYSSIVASGKNACILHYINNQSKLNESELILIDAGCEYEGYASDITRTFPIGGKFSKPQRDLYSIVLEAQKAAIAQVKKNNSFNDPHFAAVKVLAQGLKDLKILQGSVNSIIEKEEYKKFYMHRTSHWMGLDVHDVGDYFDHRGKPVKLKNGQILTIEPGLYFSDDRSVPKVFRNIGIRIEDDVLVNNSHPEVLTSSCPKEIDELESIIGKG